MKLKRILLLAFSFLVLMRISVPAMAAETQTPGCTVIADSVRTYPGNTITIPVRIENNPGFTNFAISLEYDADKLTLLSIDTVKENVPYLCGNLVSTNREWMDPEKDTETESYGYLVAESPDVVMDNGILFTVSFSVNQGLTDTTVVTPTVHYIRSNALNTSEFAEIAVTVAEGAVTVVKPGDVTGGSQPDTGDGLVDYDDVMLIYKAFLKETTLNEEQMLAADINGNNEIDESDVEAVYNLYRGITT